MDEHEVIVQDAINLPDETISSVVEPRKGCHVMVDIETWGVGPAAIPISLGAVKFYPQEQPFGWGEKFYAAIDPKSCAVLGLQLDLDTIMFWMDKKQREPLDEWLGFPKQDIHNVLAGFSEWYGNEELPTWCRGPAFDAVILQTAYRVLQAERPWGYSKDRDVRTIQGLMDWTWKNPRMAVEPGQGGLKHNALDDAINQTLMLQGIVEALGLTLR
jgi:hypothetical protein